ncbi:MAG: hypothetical protein GDA46_02840 [Bdellovibrionales bacterium]|nr:hypothetical protein [Bdellovibrionales bacterium]
MLRGVLFFYILCLCSCLIGKSGTQGLSADVAVRVVSQFSDSAIRSSSGRPYISLHGGRRVCRSKPFSLSVVREHLEESGVPKETLNKYLFFDLEQEEVEGEDNETESSTLRRAVFKEVENNWIKFGLQIANNTDFALVIDTVRIHGRARCGSQIYTHEETIEANGYCVSGNAPPFLYIVPPKRRIEYQPLSTNPFHNLTLYFDGFPIEDRREIASRSFQNSVRSPQQVIESSEETTGGQETVRSQEGAGQSRQICQPEREDYAIPRYRIEVTLMGYFIGLTSEYVTLDFFKRVTFFTTVIY